MHTDLAPEVLAQLLRRMKLVLSPKHEVSHTPPVVRCSKTKNKFKSAYFDARSRYVGQAERQNKESSPARTCTSE